jgi:MFS family permease
MGALLGSSMFIVPQYLRNVQDYSATQTGLFFSLNAAGTGAGCVLSLTVLMPRLGPARCAAIGFGGLGTICSVLVYVLTPDTPGYLLSVLLVLQGFFLGPIIYSVGGLALSQVELPDLPESYTVLFFVRQLGTTIGIAAAAILLDWRMTFHSARMLDTANRLDPTVQSTLGHFFQLIERRGGSTSNPRLGAVQLFQLDVLKQTRLLSFIDISFCLAVLCAIGLTVVLAMRLRATRTGSRFHFTFQ